MRERACDQDRRAFVETELGGGDAGRAHCEECAAARRDFARILAAGRALGRVLPPAEVVEAAKRRLLARIERPRGAGPATLLALAGGLFLLGVLAASSPDRSPAPPGPLLTAGALGAALSGTLAGPDSPDRHGMERHPGFPRSPRWWRRRTARSRRGGMAQPVALRPAGAIMATCESSSC